MLIPISKPHPSLLAALLLAPAVATAQVPTRTVAEMPTRTFEAVAPTPPPRAHRERGPARVLK